MGKKILFRLNSVLIFGLLFGLILTGCSVNNNVVVQEGTENTATSGGETAVDADTGTGLAYAPAGSAQPELANATYKSEWTQNGAATLVNGEYSEEAAPGSATKTVVKLTKHTADGELNGQQVTAVILVTDPGGSGTFYDLHLMVNQEGKPVNVASASLGDRVEIFGVIIANNEIQVDMKVHGPDDPMCCPTQDTVKYFAWQDDKLVETRSEVAESKTEGGSADGSSIVNIVWEWQSFKDQSGQNDITVTDPLSYRLQLLPDSTYRFKADCNVGSGGYTLDGGSLTFQPGPVTLAMCGPQSLSDQYLSLLGQVATYVQEGDKLVLNLMADGGNMHFSQLHAVTGKITTQGEATLPAGSISEVKVMDDTNTQMGGEHKDVTGFPIDFEANYNVAAVDPNRAYSLDISIKDSQGNVLFVNKQSYNVLTQGNPTYDLEVMVEAAGSQSGASQIHNVEWQWTELSGTAVETPKTIPDPGNYTIIFKPDGAYSGKADCNNISGTYSQENGGFQISPGVSTMAACGPDSLDQEYLRLLYSVAAGGSSGDGLALESAGGAERMTFQNGGAVSE